jgi:hypothetical protein
MLVENKLRVIPAWETGAYQLWRFDLLTPVQRSGLGPLISRQAHRTPGMPGSYLGVGHARLFAANENT